LSAPRLAAALDRVDMTNFRETDEVTSGHGWCRPTCPTLKRTWVASDLAVKPAVFSAATNLVTAGLLPDPTAGAATLETRVSYQHKQFRVIVTGQRSGGKTTVTVTLISRR
jgi:hypothetical protein